MWKLASLWPKCRLCKKNRDHAGLLICCPNASICDVCVEVYNQLVPSETAVRCTFCNKQPGNLVREMRRSQVWICAECLKSCNDAMNKSSTLANNLSALSGGNQTATERDTFYRSAMHWLRTEQLQESSGKMIANMIDIKPSKSLLPYARRWLAQYPDHEDAPKLVGHWLEKFDTNEAMYLAEYYLRTVSRTTTLRPIVRAIGNSRRRPRRIYDLIESRLEKESSHDVWSCLQRFEGKNNRKAEKIVLRWLELNRSNADMGIIVSSVALFTQSAEIIESTILWAETVRNSRDHYFVLSHLLRNRSEAQVKFMPRIADLASTWVKDHPDNERCGRIYWDLISFVQNPDHIQDAKSWLAQHQSNASAPWALAAILQHQSQQTDMDLVRQAKEFLSKKSPEERPAALIGALLNAHPDEEVIAMARDKCVKGGWLLGELLKIAPDDKLIAQAKESLAESPNAELERDLFVVLLKKDPTNRAVRSGAQRWLRKHGSRVSGEELTSILSEQADTK